MGRLARIFASAALCLTALALCGDGRLPPGALTPFPRPGEAEYAWREFSVYAEAAFPMPEVRVYRGKLDFLQTAVGYVPQAAAYAVGFYLDGRIHVLDQGNPALNRRVLRHELVHALLDTGGAVPRWFNEGLAGYLEEPRPAAPPGDLARWFAALGVDLDRRGWQDASRLRRLYSASRLAVQYLAATRGEARLRQLVKALVRGEDFAPAFRRLYGLTPSGLEAEMRVRARFDGMGDGALGLGAAEAGRGPA